MKRSNFKSILAVATALLALTAAAYACNVPVFRFALERWRADAYRVTVFHKGPLTDAERELFRPLEEQQDHQLSNVLVRVVDVNELDGASGDEAQGDKALLSNVSS